MMMAVLITLALFTQHSEVTLLLRLSELSEQFRSASNVWAAPHGPAV